MLNDFHIHPYIFIHYTYIIYTANGNYVELVHNMCMYVPISNDFEAEREEATSITDKNCTKVHTHTHIPI